MKKGSLVIMIVGIVLASAIYFTWPFLKFVLGLDQYTKVHYAIFQSASSNRLQLLAEQSVTMIHEAGTNWTAYFRNSKDYPIPAQFADLDPSWVSVQSDGVNLELFGGFDHCGFRIRPSENTSNVWDIFRYTESGEVSAGTYSPKQ